MNADRSTPQGAATSSERGRLGIAAGLAANTARLVGASTWQRLTRGSSPSPIRAPAEMDAAWMTRALAESFPGVEVRSVRVVDATDGTTSRARLELTCAPSDGATPPSVFAKVSPRLGHRILLSGLGLIQGEVRFYERLRNSVPVRVPEAYHVAFHAPSARFALILEDVAAQDARFGIATEPIGPAEAGRVLDALARLHGTFWMSPRLGTDLSWLETSTDGSFADFYRVVPMPLSKGLRRAGASVPPALARPDRVLDAYRRLQRANAAGPGTVLHGDTHLGNLYFPGGGEPGFLDWQVVRQGTWAHDVGYFLVSALEVEDRRRHERELLDRYLGGLCSAAPAGAPLPTPEEAWDRYRCQPAYGFPMWLGTLALGDYQTDDVARVNVERFAAAALDLGTFEALSAA